jgi:hypothetical protein
VEAGKHVGAFSGRDTNWQPAATHINMTYHEDFLNGYMMIVFQASSCCMSSDVIICSTVNQFQAHYALSD